MPVEGKSSWTILGLPTIEIPLHNYHQHLP